MFYLDYLLLVLTSDSTEASCLGSISSICEFCKDRDNCRAPPRLNLMCLFLAPQEQQQGIGLSSRNHTKTEELKSFPISSDRDERVT